MKDKLKGFFGGDETPEVVNTDEYNNYYYGYGYLKDYEHSYLQEESIEYYD